ncbi:MAG: hypothetical protein GEV11_19755 [Streptosporangiales bacterium]|nr:hypothetical protein [Streptosporangiales bacterium]
MDPGVGPVVPAVHPGAGRLSGARPAQAHHRRVPRVPDRRLLGEGIGFNPPPATEQVLLVADESGPPAVAGILASLPDDSAGRAIVEIPAQGDIRDLRVPTGVTLDWIVRRNGTPGQTALTAATGSASRASRSSAGPSANRPRPPASASTGWPPASPRTTSCSAATGARRTDTAR